MRIVCPSCASVYQVPDAAVTPTTVVECVRCHHQWTPDTEPPTAAEAPPTAIRAGLAWDDVADSTRPAGIPSLELPPREPVAQSATRARGGLGLTVAWVASVAVLVALVWAGYSFRGRVMQDWPPSIRLYAALGLGDR
jgi:predicted Zn finger-like uncharacterized protein